jgi:NADH:ubiquinone oxidoreductase subunit 2 (subunit N)
LDDLVLLISLGSYLIGIFLTLYQKKLIRFLAYGSISHIGLVFSTFILNDFSD